MRWLRAPLVHFLAGGAALFVLLHRGGPPAAPVVVTVRDVDRLRLDYTRETGLAPTAADEAALVDEAIEEEVLFREALARGLDRDRSVRNWLVEQMRVLSDDGAGDAEQLHARALALGLDRTDAVVRRILVQKVRLLAARSGERPPSDADLATFYAAHRGEYRPPDRVSFWHVFLASGGHGEAEAAAELARLQGRSCAAAAVLRRGDPFAVPPHVIGQAPLQLERLFGAAFATAVQGAEVGSWIGPVPSPYGVHLVCIEAREQGVPPPLDAVRERVRERWQDERRGRRVRELVRELERRTPLRVESAAWRERRPS